VTLAPTTQVLSDWQPNSASAVVALSHDPKLDDLALIAALRSPAYYIAALGSRKNHANRLERLAAAGFGADAGAAAGFGAAAVNSSISTSYAFPFTWTRNFFMSARLLCLLV